MILFLKNYQPILDEIPMWDDKKMILWENSSKNPLSSINSNSNVRFERSLYDYNNIISTYKKMINMIKFKIMLEETITCMIPPREYGKLYNIVINNYLL